MTAPVARVAPTGRAPRSLSAVVLLWLLLPVVPLVVWAVADRWSAPAVLPQDWGLRGWDAAADAGVVGALARSTALGLVVAAIATPLGAMAGRALGWRELRHPGPVAWVLVAPVVLPPFAVAMGLDVVLLRLGVPELVGVVLVLVTLAVPYTAYTLGAAYAALDPQLEEQARTLGATARQARRRATLPAVAPGLLTAAGLAFLVGWSDYVVTLLIGGGRLVTAPILLGSAAAGAGNEPTTAALAVASTLPLALAVATVLLVRHRYGGRP
ncbi:ABC transporter permease [Nocardioides sp. GCM10027113]|uniref:ABC transporter permease n=1 Tax=unclassified Nocardioides TaxID=2615069 RepID=UPI003619D419